MFYKIQITMMFHMDASSHKTELVAEEAIRTVSSDAVFISIGYLFHVKLHLCMSFFFKIPVNGLEMNCFFFSYIGSG